jgi:ubiquinol-cytochrome c reductase cytochrome b subunit
MNLYTLKPFTNLPTPQNLTYLWNYGSLLLLLVSSQIVTGVLLAIGYIAGGEIAYWVMDSVFRDIELGWLLRYLHISGASVFFVFLYVHMGRGVYYGLFTKTLTWVRGVTIYLIRMGVSFLGYILP